MSMRIAAQFALLLSVFGSVTGVQAADLEFFNKMVDRSHGLTVNGNGTVSIDQAKQAEWPKPTTKGGSTVYDWADPHEGGLGSPGRNRFVIEKKRDGKPTRFSNLQDTFSASWAYGGLHELKTVKVSDGEVESVTVCRVDSKQKFRNKSGFEGELGNILWDAGKAIVQSKEEVKLVVDCDTVDREGCEGLAAFYSQADKETLSRCEDKLIQLDKMKFASDSHIKADRASLLAAMRDLQSSTKPILAKLKFDVKELESAFAADQAKYKLLSSIMRLNSMSQACEGFTDPEKPYSPRRREPVAR